MNKFSNISRNQFVHCDANGVLDLTRIGDCPALTFCNEALSPDPCFTRNSAIASCKIPPVKFNLVPSTTTTSSTRYYYLYKLKRSSIYDV